MSKSPSHVETPVLNCGPDAHLLRWSQYLPTMEGSGRMGQRLFPPAPLPTYHQGSGVEGPSPPPWELCQLSLLGRLGDQSCLSSQTQIPFPCASQEKKQRRAENLKRRLENERKAEIVQVVSMACLGVWVLHSCLYPCLLSPFSC